MERLPNSTKPFLITHLRYTFLVYSVLSDIKCGQYYHVFYALMISLFCNVQMLRDLKEVNRHAKRKQDGICHGLSTAVHKKKLAVTKLNAIAERLAVGEWLLLCCLIRWGQHSSFMIITIKFTLGYLPNQYRLCSAVKYVICCIIFLF